MNLGFLDDGTAAHEFGHAIGLAHEHQNPREALSGMRGRPSRAREIPEFLGRSDDPPQRPAQIQRRSTQRDRLRSQIDHALLLPRLVDNERDRHGRPTKCFPTWTSNSSPARKCIRKPAAPPPRPRR
jgi:hypothetical protein